MSFASTIAAFAPRAVEVVTFCTVLVQAVRHRTAHQSVLSAVAQAQSHAERAAAGAAAAASQASQVLALMVPHATQLAMAVDRLPVSRGKRAQDADPAVPEPTAPQPTPQPEPQPTAADIAAAGSAGHS